MARIAIIGAGISGLSTAYFINKYAPSYSVDIYEATNRIGGLIRTEHIEDSIVEVGPKTIRMTEKNHALQEILADLNLIQQTTSISKSSQARYIVYDGRVVQVPSSIKDFLCTKLGRAIIKALIKEPFIEKSSYSDESVYDFFMRRIGRICTENLIDPLIAGIFAEKPEHISMRSAFPELYDIEQKYSSLVIGMLCVPRIQKKIVSFQGGLETLTNAIKDKLSSSLYLSSPVEKIYEKANKAYLTIRGQVVEYDMIISTLAPISLQRLLLNKSMLYTYLEKLRMTSCISVVLTYPKRLGLHGFGMLCPSRENTDLLGIVYDSALFPDRFPTYDVLSVIMGGRGSNKMLGFSENTLIMEAQQYVAYYLGYTQQPLSAYVYKYPNAIFAPYVGFFEEQSKIMEQAMRSIVLGGSAFWNISIPNCIEGAKKIATSLYLQKID